MHRAGSQWNGSTIQELRAERALTLAVDGTPPLASPEISCSPTPRRFAHPASDSLIPFSANSDSYCSSQQFHRNVRVTTTV
ncbi:unnamed protein product [Toxocara canis]|nr:unnamed protein product [Toxocara canis]